VKPLVVASSRNGLGLFAPKFYRAGESIIRIEGRIVAADVLWDRGGVFADNCFRFGPETYLDPGDGPGRFLNHSCEPNAGIRKLSNRLFLVAAGRITVGTEIVLDYSTILGDDDIWTMRCNCGSRTCRKRIRRFGSLPRAKKEDYFARGLVPKYIVRTLE
jgi:hypothetical protein